MAKGDWLKFLIGALGGPMGAKAAQTMDVAQKGRAIEGQSLEQYKEKRDFPEYETPQSYKDFLGLTKTQARQQMPGYTQMKEDIGASAAQTLSQASRMDTSSATAALLGTQQNRMRALRQLGVMASQYQTQAQQRYTQAVGAGAPYEESGYQYNQWLPWQMKMNEQMGREMAGQQMTSNLLDQMMAFSFQGANLAGQQNWYNQMNPYGQQQQMMPQQPYMQPYNPYTTQVPPNQQTPPAQASPYPQGSMGGFSGPNTYNW